MAWIILMGSSLFLPASDASPRPDARISEVRQRVKPGLERDLTAKGFEVGNPLFIRIFKESLELEVWLKPGSSPVFKLWKKWPIAAMSGKLGPKLKEGDRQAPEGFYTVKADAFNPMSRFHLSFNIGYPNAYDEAQGCTGSLIMVHGNRVSTGCFAMTDPVIEEIYLLAEAALKAGQHSVAVHVFPFRMTDERLKLAGPSPWQAFWKDLHAGYAAFEETGLPPETDVRAGRYVVK